MACDPEIISFGPSIDVPQIYRIRPYAVVSIKAPNPAAVPPTAGIEMQMTTGLKASMMGNQRAKHCISYLIC